MSTDNLKIHSFYMLAIETSSSCRDTMYVRTYVCTHGCEYVCTLHITFMYLYYCTHVGHTRSHDV